MSEEQSGDDKRVSPTVFQAVLMDEIAGKLGELITLTKEQIPQGIKVIPPGTSNGKLTVTTTVTDIILREGPWFSVIVRNDGPNPILYTINDVHQVDWVDVESGETDETQFNKPLINRIYIQSTTGTSNVRIYGTK